GHYKGFISGQVKEGSGANMSRRRRMTMLALAPIIERAAERLAPGGARVNPAQAEQFTAQLDIPVICVGGFHTAAGMQSAIETNQCDAVSAARAFIAAPYLSQNPPPP